MPSINGFPRLLKRKLILATFLQTDDKTALSLSSVSKSFHAAVRPQQLAKILKDVLHYRLKEHNAELLLLFLKHIFKLSALSGLAFHIKARDLNEERLRELPGWVGERCFDVGFIHGEEVKAFIKALRVLEGVRDALPEKFNITTIAALFVGTMYEGSIVQLEEHAVPDYFKPSARCYRALRGLVEERLKDVVGREACKYSLHRCGD